MCNLQLAKAAGCWNIETTAKDGLRTKAELGVQLRPITSTLATVAHGTFVGRARRDRRVIVGLHLGRPHCILVRSGSRRPLLAIYVQ